MVQLSESEKLLRDIETMRESVQIDRIDLANLRFTPEERAGVLKHIAICMSELAALQKRLWEIDDA